MHWVVQDNLFKDAELADLVGAFERFDIPFSMHKVIPFVGVIVPAAQPKQEKVICLGSYSMRHAAKRLGWDPGVYDLIDRDFSVQLRHWGDRMLNADSKIMRFKDIPALTEPMFLRPVDDGKYFAGAVFTPDDFNGWRHKVVAIEDETGASLTGETLVQLSHPTTIYAEYRFWVVNGAVVAKSLYKRGDIVVHDGEVDERFDEFVMDCVKVWQPHRAFVIDVCDTPAGIKIVEINTINAAGFYAAKVQSIVLSLEEMEHA